MCRKPLAVLLRMALPSCWTSGALHGRPQQGQHLPAGRGVFLRRHTRKTTRRRRGAVISDTWAEPCAADDAARAGRPPPGDTQRIDARRRKGPRPSTAWAAAEARAAVRASGGTRCRPGERRHALPSGRAEARASVRASRHAVRLVHKIIIKSGGCENQKRFAQKSLPG
jgi:hypothetical protein